ncbi:MAG: SDR family NAD(P)-dependent oxidoreductase, partial [Thermoanaerobaculia bacterium]
ESFGFAEVIDAFRHMSRARHTGKIVVSHRASRRAPQEIGELFQADGTYLITGGLGALGLQVARWMVERGAGHLVLMGRHAPSDSQQQALRELEEAGARVESVRGDVSRRQDMVRIFAAIDSRLPPVKGIVHAAGVLDDGALIRQQWPRFASVLEPKVQGAWNLHELSRELPLDFFVLFSSAAALLGSPGQGNYAAANAFLDVLAHHRQARGLPATSIDWGPWGEVGMAARSAQQRGWQASQGMSRLTPRQGLEVLAQVLRQNPPQVAVLPIDWRRALASLPEGSAPPLLESFLDHARTRPGVPRVPAPEADAPRPAAWVGRLRKAAAGERREILVSHLRELAARVLGLESTDLLEPERPLQELGLDSLMAIELRNHLQTSLGKSFSATLLFDYPTLGKLVDHLIRELSLDDSSPEAAAPPVTEERRPFEAERAVAILGLGCRFPGGADDPQALWRLLSDGVDAITEVPPERWDIEAFYQPEPGTPGKLNTRHGGFLREIDRFDAGFFGIGPQEATIMDPQQRWLVEIAWEALENACQVPDELAGSRTGVYVGISTADYAELQTRHGDASSFGPFVATGNTLSIAAGRLSYLLGLQGPSMALDTSCSSSLVAIHLACQALRTGECDLALAGGVNAILLPELTVQFAQTQVLASDGRCKSFDRSADGYVRSEGCGIVVLKRLSEAIRDGDPIRAVIRGSAVNQNGRSGGLAAPNGPAQEAVIREALANAGVEPAEVGYVEAHATGTALGDTIEVQSLGRVLGAERPADQPLKIGSIKTNIGHAEAAAGIASVAKAVLTLEHGEIPPHLHLREPNP